MDIWNDEFALLDTNLDDLQVAIIAWLQKNK
jgi:hypothetical protein